MEYDVEDLWLGFPADVDDNTWHAVEYEDGSVQFIHMEDKTQIWQDRTVVSTRAGRGRAEAHYIETEDIVLLALANNNRSPTEYGTLLSVADFIDDWESLPEDRQDGVLWLLLVEWVESIGYVVDVPITDELVEETEQLLDGDVDPAEDFENATVEEQLQRGVEAYRNGAERYVR